FAFTQPATEISTVGARFNGMISPEGVAASAWFDWGTNSIYGQRTSMQTAGSGRGVVRVTSAISGLTRGAIIHFRLAGSNASQIVHGSDQQFIAGARVQAWGDNSSGQTSVPSNVGDVTLVAGGLSQSLALRADATIAGWGNNADGQITIPAALGNAA